LVDDAIVEVENIVRHLRMGKSPYQAAMEAADEIGLAVIATDVGATAEWVGADNGVLLPRPDVGALRTAIERFIGMPTAKLYQLQSASIAKARECTWDLVTAKTIAAIQSHRDPVPP
jgi:glycosyltransferase involved in cell wall biosynthesis